MDIQFKWGGHPINPQMKESIESSLRRDINKDDEFKNFKSASVHFTNDTLKSSISGVIINHNNEPLFTVTVDPYNQNRTDYTPIEG